MSCGKRSLPPIREGSEHGAVPFPRLFLIFGSKAAIFVQNFFGIQARGHRTVPIPPKIRQWDE